MVGVKIDPKVVMDLSNFGNCVAGPFCFTTIENCWKNLLMRIVTVVFNSKCTQRFILCDRDYLERHSASSDQHIKELTFTA